MCLFARGVEWICDEPDFALRFTTSVNYGTRLSLPLRLPQAPFHAKCQGSWSRQRRVNVLQLVDLLPSMRVLLVGTSFASELAVSLTTGNTARYSSAHQAMTMA